MVFTRKDGIFMGYVSFREGILIDQVPCHLFENGIRLEEAGLIEKWCRNAANHFYTKMWGICGAAIKTDVVYTSFFDPACHGSWVVSGDIQSSNECRFGVLIRGKQSDINIAQMAISHYRTQSTIAQIWIINARLYCKVWQIVQDPLLFAGSKKSQLFPSPLGHWSYRNLLWDPIWRCWKKPIICLCGTSS